MAGWIFRKLVQLLLVACVLLALAAICIVLFVNPTKFKNQINSMIQSRTGYQIEVRGNIEWAFRPQLTLHLQDVNLAGPQGFKSPFFVAKDVHIYMNLSSLFGSNLIINKIDASGMVITVERQESGARNIDTLPNKKQAPSNRLTINELNITNSTLLYQNEQSHRHWALNNASLNMHSIVFNPNGPLTPMKISGDYTQLDYNLSCHVDTTVSIDTTKIIASLDPLTISWDGVKLEGTATVGQYPQEPVVNGKLTLAPVDLDTILALVNSDLAAANPDLGKLQGNFTFNYASPEKILEFSEFDLQLGEGSVKGNTRVNFNGPYMVGFDVTLNKLTLLPLFAIAKGITPIIIKQVGMTNVMEHLKTIAVSGKISGSELKLNSDFVFDHLTGDVGIAKGVMQIGPIIFRAYNGGHNFGVTIDLNQEIPQIKLVEVGNNVDLDQWLKLFHIPKFADGVAEIKFALQGSGFDISSFKQSINGDFSCNVKNGTLYGLDLDKLSSYIVLSTKDILSQVGSNKNSDLTKLISLKSGDWASSQKNPATKFDGLRLKSTFKEGIANTSMAMNSAAYDIDGSGTYKVLDNNVAISAQVATKAPPADATPELALFMKQNPLPVTISGQLSSLSFKPELQNYLAKAVTKSQDALINTAASKMVDATGPSISTTLKAEEIFVNSIQGLK